jgi:hypothetical protein
MNSDIILIIKLVFYFLCFLAFVLSCFVSLALALVIQEEKKLGAVILLFLTVISFIASSIFTKLIAIGISQLRGG